LAQSYVQKLLASTLKFESGFSKFNLGSLKPKVIIDLFLDRNINLRFSITQEAFKPSVSSAFNNQPRSETFRPT
jgi:hypothetical protein